VLVAWKTLQFISGGFHIHSDFPSQAIRLSLPVVEKTNMSPSVCYRLRSVKNTLMQQMNRQPNKLKVQEQQGSFRMLDMLKV
jgi:hypothetical protein